MTRLAALVALTPFNIVLNVINQQADPLGVFGSYLQYGVLGLTVIALGTLYWKQTGTAREDALAHKAEMKEIGAANAQGLKDLIDQVMGELRRFEEAREARYSRQSEVLVEMGNALTNLATAVEKQQDYIKILERFLEDAKRAEK